MQACQGTPRDKKSLRVSVIQLAFLNPLSRGSEGLRQSGAPRVGQTRRFALIFKARRLTAAPRPSQPTIPVKRAWNMLSVRHVLLALSLAAHRRGRI